MFNFIETQDGSPTVRIALSEGETESMHSLRGAFSETVYIYGTAIEESLVLGFEPRVFSLGLGLGYVEILAAALFLKHGALAGGGESFELVPELRDWFRAWAVGTTDSGIPQRFQEVYEEILGRTADYVGLPEAEIKAFLADRIEGDHWRLSGPLETSTEIQGRFGCICFDAFSSKTTPELWSEEFLNSFLDRAAAHEGAVLSTYACTGALKRALKSQGFEVQIREGFASKRDSTYAVKGRAKV